jgi:hypothetical protein
MTALATHVYVDEKLLDETDAVEQYWHKALGKRHLFLKI